jgi:predicted deacylase
VTRTSHIDAFGPGEFRPGARERLWLEVPLELTGPIRLPALVCVGSQPGPTLLAAAGVHGDEFEGICAVQEAFGALDQGSLRGTFLGLPICNPLAFESGTRESPSHAGGGNLARVFPGDPGGDVTARLAAHLFALVRRWLGTGDLLLDLHSAGTRYRMLSTSGFRAIASPAAGPSEEAARRFGIPRIWVMDDEPGMLNSEATRVGIPAVGTEAPGQAGNEASDRREYVDGIKNMLCHLGIVDGRLPEPTLGPAYRVQTVRVSTAGLLVSRAQLGEDVAGGDVLAEVRSPLGKVLEQVQAPLSGSVWCVRTFASIKPSEAAAWLATESRNGS